MIPGKELDAIIAEKVMGWTEIKNEQGVQPSADLSSPVIFSRKIPPYSTYIGAAFEVVEKIVTAKLDGLGWFDLRFVNGNYEASFKTDAYYKHVDHERAPTPAHAICLAALRAVEKP